MPVCWRAWAEADITPTRADRSATIGRKQSNIESLENNSVESRRFGSDVRHTPDVDVLRVRCHTQVEVINVRPRGGDVKLIRVSMVTVVRQKQTSCRAGRGKKS